MNLDLVNSLANSMKNNKLIQSFTKELQDYLENRNGKNIEKEEILLLNPTHNENKIITRYRDEMLIRRNSILNNYAKNTWNKGEMYYIYGENSKMENGYNLCICEEGRSHEVIEVEKSELPINAEIGSVLRKHEDKYFLDEEATKEIAEEIYNMKEKLLEEQKQYLESQRIEEHIYEMTGKDEDRAWLFDITNDNGEEIEEIDFPEELLKDSKEGDLFLYKDGEYIKNIEKNNLL